MRKWLDQPKPVFSLVLTMILTVAAAAAATLAEAYEGGKWWWWAVGALCAVGILVVQYSETRAARLDASSVTEAERAARVRLTLAVNSLFQDIARNLGELLSRPPNLRNEARTDLVTGCLLAASASRLLNCDDVRANFYLIRPNGNLEPVASKGRVPSATASFISGTTAHTTAMRMIEDSSKIFCTDVAIDAPDGFTLSGHSYRTFISVPVQTRNANFGMLTIDALEPGDLQEEHVELARALAQFIAAALAAG